MASQANPPVFRKTREPRIRYYGALTFSVMIAAIGWLMMTISSSPSMKGAAFLWLPAALQLLAGVWLGPYLGLIAGGLGAYAAGILAYGGWGLPDIIMNPVAGGLANSMLPAILFPAFRIDPALGSNPRATGRVVAQLFVLLVVIMTMTLVLNRMHLGLWGYAPQLVLTALAPIYLRSLRTVPNRRDLLLGALICVVSCLLSALIGSAGAVVGGLSWKGALVGVGVGWFFGDTTSSLLGLYMLAALTNRARSAGLCK
jgi:hypothetical protein